MRINAIMNISTIIAISKNKNNNSYNQYMTIMINIIVVKKNK